MICFGLITDDATSISCLLFVVASLIIVFICFRSSAFHSDSVMEFDEMDCSLVSYYSASSFSVKSHVSRDTCENISLCLFRTKDVTCTKQWRWRRGLIITAWGRWWKSLFSRIRWWSPTNDLLLSAVVMNCTLSSWRVCLKVSLTTFTFYALTILFKL